MHVYFALIFLMVLTQSFPKAASASEEWRLHTQGLGPIRIGMKLSELPGHVRSDLELNGPNEERCTYYIRDSERESFRLRVIENRIDRIEVSSRTFSTLSGLRVGDDFAAPTELYGSKLTIYDDKYDYDYGVKLMIFGPHIVNGKSYGVTIIASPSGGVNSLWAGNFKGLRETEGCS